MVTSAQLKAAGFTDHEIALHEAGFSDDEIAADKSAASAPAPAPPKPTVTEALNQARKNGNFGSTSTPFDPNASIGNEVVRAAKNFIPSTANYVGNLVGGGVTGVAQALTDPVKAFEGVKSTAEHAADILKGGVQKIRDISPSELQGDAPRMDTSAYDKFAQGNYEKFGTVPRAVHTFADDPAPAVLAAASILHPGYPAVSTPINGAIPKPVPPPVPSIAELKAGAGALYDKAKSAGVVINGQSFSNFADDIRNAMKGEGIDKDLHPNATAVVRRINETQGDVPLNDLETLRKVAGDAADTPVKSDKRLSRIIIDKIDDYAQNLQPHNVVAGNAPQAVSLLHDARSLWQRSARGETIQKLIDKAQLEGGALKIGLEDAYRRQFKKLAENERGIARFSPVQQKAIKAVAFGQGPVQNALRIVGKIVPDSRIGAMATGGFGTAAFIGGMPPPVAAGIVAAGLGGKIASTRITARNAKLASVLARTKQ